MPPTRPRVLVVAEHQLAQRCLRRLLAADGYTIDVAPTSAEAFAHAAAGDVDLILVDLTSAGADGLELCRRLRARADEIYLPVILLAPADDAAQRQAGLAAGADDYVLEPFDGEELR